MCKIVVKKMNNEEELELKLERFRKRFRRRPRVEATDLEEEGPKGKKHLIDADTVAAAVAAAVAEAPLEQAQDADGVEAEVQMVAEGAGFKVIVGTSFVVDGFGLKEAEIPENAVFFLSHFHSDHYGGITKSWKRKIYCSAITGALVVQNLGVNKALIHTLSLNETVVIQGVEVTCFDANHCPGAVLFLFQSPKLCALHCGDFRWNKQLMLKSPKLASLKPRDLSHLYLDTTFNDAKFDFPLQEEVVEKGVGLALEFLARSKTTVVFFGSYSIGKERLFLAVAKAANEKIFASEEKQKLLRAAGCDMSWFVSEEEKARLRVVSMGKCGFQALCNFSQENPHHDWVVGFSPSGWNWAKVWAKMCECVCVFCECENKL